MDESNSLYEKGPDMDGLRTQLCPVCKTPMRRIVTNMKIYLTFILQKYTTKKGTNNTSLYKKGRGNPDIIGK